MPTKRPPLRTGPPQAKALAYKYMVFVEQLIKDLLSKNENVLASSDRELLKSARKTLRPAFQQQVKYFFEPMHASEPWVGNAGYWALYQVMQATNLGCSSAIIRDSVRDYLTSILAAQTAQKQAAMARQALAAKRAPQKSETLAAVRAAVKKTPAKPTRSEAYARLLQPLVKERLGRNVSVSTVRRCVTAILEERT
jgi:hypothetical protein